MTNAIQQAAQQTASSLAGAATKTTTTVTATTTTTTSTTTKSGSSSGTDSASDALNRLADQVAAMRQQQRQKKIKVQDFQKASHDLKVDNRLTARNVGVLRHDNSRLNVISALSKDDNADFFAFKMSTTAEAKFGLLTNDGKDEASLRFQFLKKNGGAVVADSDPKSGKAKVAYDQLKAGKFKLEAGDYVLRITRQDDSKANLKTEYNYAIQLSSGVYKNDFDTIEKGVDPKQDPFGITVSGSVTTLTGSLGSAVSYLQSLPRL
ncbi:MAG TPA: hypothetical protein VN229_20565, partial [Terriglobales bacterium]|nr:hypothetical protein [Terriglobales bacterium]